MSRPIPRKLLPHTIAVSPLLGVDDWNNPTYGEAVNVKFVRVENIRKNLLNSQGENKDDKALVFVDMKNTSPRVTYSKGDLVVYGGINYTIREILEECGDSPEVHHLEIALK